MMDIIKNFNRKAEIGDASVEEAYQIVPIAAAELEPDLDPKSKLAIVDALIQAAELISDDVFANR